MGDGNDFQRRDQNGDSKRGDKKHHEKN